MKIEVEPAENPGQLAENLDARCESASVDGEKVEVKAESPELLGRVPGVESYTFDGKRHDGLGGRPVQERAYCRIASREDAARAFLATVQGYDLIVLQTDREWDLRQLRQYNPDIKQISQHSPPDFLEVEKCVGEIEDLEQVKIEMPEEVTADEIYRNYLT